jgi:hypothetical protein
MEKRSESLTEIINIFQERELKNKAETSQLTTENVMN